MTNKSEKEYSGVSHSFDTGIALRYGFEAGTLYNHLVYWITHNKIKGINQKKGKTWTYDSYAEMQKYMAYMTVAQVRKGMERLLESGLVIKDNFNENRFDKTAWYSLRDENKIVNSNFVTDVLNPAHRRAESSTSMCRNQHIDKLDSAHLYNADIDTNIDQREDTHKGAASAANSELALGVCFFYCDAMKKANNIFREPKDPSPWIAQFESMITKDNRQVKDIEAVITYLAEQVAAGNSFWISRIGTPVNFRRHFPTIYTQMHESKLKEAKNTAKNAPNDLRRDKITLATQNRDWADKLILGLKEREISTRDYITANDTYVSLKTGAAWQPLGYAEAGFRDIVTSHLYKSGIYGESDTIQRAYSTANSKERPDV